MTAKEDGEKSADLVARDTGFDLAVKPVLSAEKQPYRLPGKEKNGVAYNNKILRIAFL